MSPKTMSTKSHTLIYKVSQKNHQITRHKHVLLTLYDIIWFILYLQDARDCSILQQQLYDVQEDCKDLIFHHPQEKPVNTLAGAQSEPGTLVSRDKFYRI